MQHLVSPLQLKKYSGTLLHGCNVQNLSAAILLTIKLSRVQPDRGEQRLNRKGFLPGMQADPADDQILFGEIFGNTAGEFT